MRGQPQWFAGRVEPRRGSTVTGSAHSASVGPEGWRSPRASTLVRPGMPALQGGSLLTTAASVAPESVLDSAAFPTHLLASRPPVGPSKGMQGMRSSLLRTLALAAALSGLGACAYPEGYVGDYGGGYVAQPYATYGYGGVYAARPYPPYAHRPPAYRPVPGYVQPNHGGWTGRRGPPPPQAHDGGGIGGLVGRLGPRPGGPPPTMTGGSSGRPPGGRRPPSAAGGSAPGRRPGGPPPAGGGSSGGGGIGGLVGRLGPQ